ncbi:MAG: hypothetical protein JWM57_4232 [Phycisphaerales bacterium]|nr:hypothetical protein [Phycisphaerales bacterium]
MKNLWPAAMCASLLLATVSVRADDTPSTPAQTRLLKRTGSDPLARHSTDMLFGPSLRVILANPVDSEIEQELRDYVSHVAVVQQEAWYAMGVDNDRPPEEAALKVSLHGFARTQDARLNVEVVAVALTGDLKLDPSLSNEQRAADLKDRRAAFETVNTTCKTLQAMLEAAAEQPRESLADRIRNWRTNDQQLTEELDSRRVRIQALTQQQQQLLKQQDGVAANDPVMAQLIKMIDLRKRKVTEVESRAPNGTASAGDVLDAQMAETEAELHLAERQSAVTSRGASAVLDQVGQEITKLQTEAIEFKIRLSDIRKQLAVFDVSNPTTQSVAQAAQLADASADHSKADALLAELNRQRTAIRADILRLKIVRIEPVAQ